MGFNRERTGYSILAERTEPCRTRYGQSHKHPVDALHRVVERAAPAARRRPHTATGTGGTHAHSAAARVNARARSCFAAGTPPRARSTVAPEEAPTRWRRALTCCSPCPSGEYTFPVPAMASDRPNCPPLPPPCIARVISPATFASGARTRGRYICRPCCSYGAPLWFAKWRPMPCPAWRDGERTSGTLTSAAAATAQRVHGLHVQTSPTGGQAGTTGVRGDDDVPVLHVLGLHNRRRRGTDAPNRPGLPFIPLHLAWI
ncbi:hypothetical protein C8F04DRAFT_1074601, partial [Mycena alexandri]